MATKGPEGPSNGTIARVFFVVLGLLLVTSAADMR